MLSAFTRSSTSVSCARRLFSTEVSHKPLIQLSGIHARYANATYIAGSKSGKLDLIESELDGLSAAATKSKSFAGFLENPLISRDDKTKVVMSMNDKLSETTRNLLVTLAGNARLSELPKIANTFSQLMKAKRGEVDAKVISVEALSDAQMKAVKAAIQSQIPSGKTVLLESILDPTILGGLQVQIGDKFLDLSVKSRVEEIARMPLT